MAYLNYIRQTVYRSLIGFLLALSPSIGFSASLNLPDSPLFNAAVEPNVMLLIDNSGSMEHIIWANGYDPTVTYPNWGYSSTDGSIYYSDIKRTIDGDSCSTGWKRGKNQSDGTTKCLRLPDPVGSGDTRYTGNYINYLFNTYAGGTDLRDGTIPNDYRMNVARNVANDFVNNASGMRIGVSSFNNNEGGRIDAACGSSASTLTTAINSLTASSWTPLSEALYEVTRYFRGLESYYNSGISYTSPIQYRCQKNFTIVITDGLPTYDTNIPTNDTDDAAYASAALPDWDNVSNDQLNGTDSQDDEGYRLYLDDVAKFAYDIDMKTSGNDTAGKSYQDSSYVKQNMNTYTIGFAVSNQMLEDAADYGGGRYFTATDSAGLTSALNDALDGIKKLSSAAAAVAANSTSLNTGSEVFLAKFNSEFWSGSLLAIPINSDGTLASPSWNSDTALENPDPSTRVIVTYKPSNERGIPFRWPANIASPTASELDPTQTTALATSAVLNYLRGDESNEGSGGTNFRRRPDTKLGDIVNSSPQYVGKPAGQYENPNLFRQAYMDADYVTFRNTTAILNRTPVVYVGANDGMLHGFDASNGANKGEEVLAFIPNQVYPNLKSLSDKAYSHKYFVDGSPTVADAKVNGNWKTVLVGGLNKGGKSIYALDVTKPADFSEANAASIVLWEYTHSDLGYTFSRPMIAKTNDNGKWAAIFGNGYNNSGTSGNAMLFVVDLSTGDLIKRIDTGVGSTTTPNGLSSVNGIDIDGNGTVDYIYGGDLRGNMWKFDLSNSNSNNWDIPFATGSTKNPLYTAKDSSATVQPITTRPDVSFHPTNTDTVMVYFGTGKYLESVDTGTTQTQTFYAVWDNNAVVNSVTTRNSNILQRQVISGPTEINGKKYRSLTTNAVNWATQKGWYQDLPVSGERVVGSPLLLKGVLFYSTFIPSSDRCVSTGTGWLMAVDYDSGGLPSTAVFDTNGADAGFGNVSTAGVEKEAGSGGTTVVGQDGIPVAMSPNTACDPNDTSCVACQANDLRPKCQEKINPKSIPGLRLSWRELINK